MPVYGYICSCGVSFDAQEMIASREHSTCKVCGWQADYDFSSSLPSRVNTLECSIYPFVQEHITGQPQVIKSKAHYKEVIHRHNQEQIARGREQCQVKAPVLE